jgi:CRP-like cAMP-binding protein
MYFIAKGDCEVFIRDEADEETFVALLRPGCHFGEISLLYDTPRSATVKATNFSTITELPKESFKALIHSFPSTLERMRLGLFNYKDHVTVFLK